jgi:hypothetical protein
VWSVHATKIDSPMMDLKGLILTRFPRHKKKRVKKWFKEPFGDTLSFVLQFLVS